MDALLVQPIDVLLAQSFHALPPPSALSTSTSTALPVSALSHPSPPLPSGLRRLCHDPRGWGPYSENNDFTPCAEEGALTVIQGLFLVLVVGWAASRWLRRGKPQVVVEGVSQESKSPLVLKGKLVSFSLPVLSW